MSRKTMDVVIQSALNLLFFISFFLPVNRIVGLLSTNISVSEMDHGTTIVVIYLLLIVGVLLYLYFKYDDKKIAKIMNLIVLALSSALIVATSLAHLETSDYYSVKMGFAPFYAGIIFILLVIYYLKHEAILQLISVGGLSNNDSTKSKNVNHHSRDYFNELQQLKSLLDQQIITEDEFNVQKENILAKLSK